MARDKKKAPTKEKAPKKEGRIKQIRLVYSMTKKTDKRIGLILLAWFVVVAAAVFGIFLLIPGIIAIEAVTAVLAGVLAVIIVFGRRGQKAQYQQIEGRPGAAAAALQQLRRGWKVDAAIAFNKQQDLVHRVVGPPGIVLVGEGNPTRLKSLLANERRKHERVASETPIHEVISGSEGGAVPVPKLMKHVSKLGRRMKPAEMTDVLQRLKALDATRSNVPLPKGPVSTSMKGARSAIRGR